MTDIDNNSQPVSDCLISRSDIKITLQGFQFRFSDEAGDCPPLMGGTKGGGEINPQGWGIVWTIVVK